MDKAPVEQTPMVQQPEVLTDDNAPPPSVMLDIGARAETRSAAEAQHDMDLEYDSMVLLATIEQMHVELSDPMMQASPPLALEYLIKLANQLLEFTEKLQWGTSRKFTLEALMTRDRKNYSQLGLQHVHDGRLSVAACEALYLRPGSIRHANTFQQLCRDLLRITNICLNICVKRFYAPEMRQQWRTVYSGFLVNLARTMQKLYTPPPDGRGA